MENCGIVLAFPVTAVASVVYAVLVIFVFARFRFARWTLLIPSVAILMLASGEAILLMARGVIGARTWIRPTFNTLHNTVVLFTPPAVANTVVFLPRTPTRDWKLVAIATFFVAIGFVFWNYTLQEILYGPNGIRGPFSMDR